MPRVPEPADKTTPRRHKLPAPVAKTGSGPHLGYFFREVIQQPFTDYRNHWRVKHAKALITEGKADLLTLEAIGKMSGFSSRNTFRATFEKFEGVSPSAYTGRIKE